MNIDLLKGKVISQVTEKTEGQKWFLEPVLKKTICFHFDDGTRFEVSNNIINSRVSANPLVCSYFENPVCEDCVVWRNNKSLDFKFCPTCGKALDKEQE